MENKKTTEKLKQIEHKLSNLPAIDTELDFMSMPVRNEQAKKFTELSKGAEIGEKTMFTGNGFFDAGLVYGRNKGNRQENRAKRQSKRIARNEVKKGSK